MINLVYSLLVSSFVFGNDSIILEETYGFDLYLTNFNKQYNEVDYNMHKSIYEENIKKIVNHNNENNTWKLGIN